MKKIKLESIFFAQLKGLKNATFTFDKPLTAVMGVNGCGKTTVLHALACVFKPDEFGENYKFSNFFTPNTDASWANSRLSISYTSESEQKNSKDGPSLKEYRKDYDRWSPRYETRPSRDVYYIGIESCLPEIERTAQTSFIFYKTEELHDSTSEKIRADAAYILNKPYSVVTKNTTKKKPLVGVRLENELCYTSLSMGTGEQRVIKILQIVHNAPAYSMILIDEIDLLLHITALKRLIEMLYRLALARHLQIVFTTHSLLMTELKQHVSIQYIDQAGQETLVYDYVDSKSIYALSGSSEKPLAVFVEDKLSQGIVLAVVEALGMRSEVEVNLYGSISNAFTLAAGIVLKNEKVENTIIVTDGDCFVKEEEKMEQIKKVLSGTENSIADKRCQALSLLLQFNLPNATTPERHIYNLVLESKSIDDEIVKVAKSICAVSNDHQLINDIILRLNENDDVVLRDIIRIAKESAQWGEMTSHISRWLTEKGKVC